jgi:16S rRNA (uracil1498-N3)-methyltransferase
MTHRFFVPPERIRGRLVEFDPVQAHQLRDVLRLKAGDVVVVFDNSGWEFDVVLQGIDREGATGRVERRRLVETEPKVKVTIFQALLKGNRFDWLLQKATEVGAVGFVPMVTARCVAEPPDPSARGKFGRWHRIVVEAAEQSRRGKVPKIHEPVSFEEACRTVQELAFIPYEGQGVQPLRAALEEATGPAAGLRRPYSVALFIGPEGGFTPEEVELARRRNIVPVSLGPRILRAETAALVALTVVLAHFGDLD